MRRLLGTLPQELYDEIYNFTFAAPPGPHTIDESWRSPVQLHISRHTRQQFAKAYFSSEFRVVLAEHLVASATRSDIRLSKIATPAAKWIAYVQLKHLSYVQSLDAVSTKKAEGRDASDISNTLGQQIQVFSEMYGGLLDGSGWDRSWQVARVARGLRLLHVQ